MNDQPLLSMRGIVKVFPGTRALDGADFTLRAAEIHALMGENGAGKSTLIKVITGVYPRDAGTVMLAGRPIDPRSPREAQRDGISTVYQEVNLVPTLTVAENIYLGRQPRRWGYLGGGIDWSAIRRQSREAIQRLNISLDVDRPLGSYSIAIQQMVAIARAVDISAKVLILDEPTSSLDKDETCRLFDIMRTLRSRGMGIIFITHFLEQVYEISDRITVLRNGKLVGEFETAALPRLQLIAKMIGRQLTQESVPSRTAHSEQKQSAFLQVRNLGRPGMVEPFDLEVHPGEVVGLAGLLGSGRTECLRLIFGIDKSASGEMKIENESVKMRSPRDSIRHRIGFCPEDRKTEAIIPDLSIRENIVLALQARQGWWRRIGRRTQNRLADQYIKMLDIRTSDAEKPIKLLSGGNQQKAILARWLATEPRLLMLDEPTRGIDVGAKFEIARLIAKLCEQGMAILFVSSELEEVVRVCNRIAVMRDRKMIAELSGEQINEETIMRTIAG